MKKLTLTIIALFIFVMASVGFSADVTLTYTDGSSWQSTSVLVGEEASEIELEWTTNSSGNAECTMQLGTALPRGIYYLQGKCIETKPGSPAPTSSYTLTIKDSYSVDILDGQGASRSTSSGEAIYIDYTPISPELTLSVTGASSGSGNKGYIKMIIHRAR